MVALGMLMLAYAAVPLYKMFCQVTGFGGTTQINAALPNKVLERMVTVRFDSNSDAKLNWDFKPDQLSKQVHVGENGLATYTVKNNSDVAVKGIHIMSHR
jgi:cytochrome c oxidase assembly protein subunit 11